LVAPFEQVDVVPLPDDEEDDWLEPPPPPPQPAIKAAAMIAPNKTLKFISISFV
jgi:hypothetical protein